MYCFIHGMANFFRKRPALFVKLFSSSKNNFLWKNQRVALLSIQFFDSNSVELHAVAQGIQHQISTNYPTPTEAVSSANEVTTTTSNSQAFTGLPVINPQQFMASAGLRLPVIGLPVSATPFDPSSTAAKLTGKVKPTVAAASKFTPY